MTSLAGQSQPPETMKKLLFFLLMGAGLVTRASDKLPLGDETTVRRYLTNQVGVIGLNVDYLVGASAVTFGFGAYPLKPELTLGEMVQQVLTDGAEYARTNSGSGGQANRQYQLVILCSGVNDIEETGLQVKFFGGNNRFYLTDTGNGLTWPGTATNVDVILKTPSQIPQYHEGIAWATMTYTNLDGSTVTLDSRINPLSHGLTVNTSGFTNLVKFPTGRATNGLAGVVILGFQNGLTKRYDKLTGLRRYDSPLAVNIRRDGDTPVVSVTGDWEAQVALEVSTDFTSWAKMTNVVLSAEGYGEIRCQSTNSSPQGFFRARYDPKE